VDLWKLGACPRRKRSFALVELMRLENPRRAEDFRYPAVVTVDQMRPALVNLAELLKEYGQRIMGGDVSVLKQVRRERAHLERGLGRESHLHQVRPRARAAFREEDYSGGPFPLRVDGGRPESCRIQDARVLQETLPGAILPGGLITWRG
jgi:hypothetical protein